MWHPQPALLDGFSQFFRYRCTGLCTVWPCQLPQAQPPPRIHGRRFLVCQMKHALSGLRTFVYALPIFFSPFTRNINVPSSWKSS